MHAHELMEVAAHLATHANAFVQGSCELESRGIGQYWVASRCRLDRWSATLRRYTSMIQKTGKGDASDLWREVRPTLEEILVSESLTRIWTAIVTAYDKTRDTCELEPVARSILIGHAESRHRALKLMISGQGLGVEHAVALNRLRRRCERWNDTLLAAASEHADVDQYAFDPNQVRGLVADLRAERRSERGVSAWQFLLASLRASFHRGTRIPAANPDLNERMAAGIMSCFSAGAFDGVGAFKSAWMIRISSVTAETQVMIDELFSDEYGGASHGRPLPGVTNDRARRF